MSQVSLIVREARVDGRLSGWSASTASRTAQTGYQERFEAGVGRLADALQEVGDALAEVLADAHDAEVRNVAIAD